MFAIILFSNLTTGYNFSPLFFKFRYEKIKVLLYMKGVLYLKKYSLLFAALLMIAPLSACSKPSTPAVEITQPKETPPEEALPQRHDFFELLREGRGENIEFGIGTKTETIVNKWGEADMEDYFLGGTFLTYGNITFFTDAVDYAGKVAVIGISDNTNIFGVKVGMTFDEIKEILGAPVIEATTDTEDELYGGDWRLVYESGEYKVSFMAKDKSSATYAAYIEAKDKN